MARKKIGFWKLTDPSERSPQQGKLLSFSSILVKIWGPPHLQRAAVFVQQIEWDATWRCPASLAGAPGGAQGQEAEFQSPLL